MLNQEGLALLCILGMLLLLLLTGFAKMGSETTLRARRLGERTSAQGTAVGLLFSTLTVTSFSVLPGGVYLYGVQKALMALGMGIGLTVLLCWLLPRAYQACAHGTKTLAHWVSEGANHPRLVRGAFAGVEAAVQCLIAAAGIGLMARIFAGVFSLHYLLALGAALLLNVLLSLLCGTAARRRMEGVALPVLVLFVGGLLAAAILTQGKGANTLATVLDTAFSHVEGTLPHFLSVPGDLLWGVGALGLTAVLRRGFSARDDLSLRQGSRIAAAACWIGLLAVCALGLFGRMMDDTLSSQTAAETVLLQMAESTLLPDWISALLLSALGMALLLIVHQAMAAFGDTMALDILRVQERTTLEKPVLRAASLWSLAAAGIGMLLATEMNQPLLWLVQAACLLAGAGLGVSLVRRLLDKSFTADGLFAGLAVGTLSALVWVLVPVTRGFGMIGMLPCAGLSLLAGVVFERSVRKKQETEEAQQPPQA